jgi:hypothetical protein
VDILDILHYQEEYSSATVYTVGDVANYSGVNYLSLGTSNFNNTPNSSPTWWVPLSPADPLSVGPLGPQAVTFVNGPVSLTSGTPTTLLTAAIPQGVFAVRLEVGNITISIGGSGTVATIAPLRLVDPFKGIYEGLYYFGSSSGLNIISDQGPGNSYSVVLTASPVIIP